MGNLQKEEVEHIKSYKKDIQYNIFIETGTRYGRTLNNISEMFKECHTIEISEYYYEYTKNGLHDKNRFPYIADRKNIIFHLGDSVETLSKLLPTIDEPIFFFLDSHYMNSGATKGVKGKIEVPVYEELDLISQRNFDDIIVIDDVRVFERKSCKETAYCDWSCISKNKILEHYPKCKTSFEHNDRFILLQ